MTFYRLAQLWRYISLFCGAVQAVRGAYLIYELVDRVKDLQDRVDRLADSVEPCDDEQPLRLARAK